MNLAKIQFVSLSTKALTTALGIIQSVIVVRILSPAEFGLVGLVMSIGSVIGVSQHLGVVDGAIREIAVRKKKREIGSVFWVSHVVRQVVTIPLSLALILLAHVIATTVYGRPEIAMYIQIFAAALILQGLQDVLGATLTGMKRFYPLYLVQIVTAFINIGIFGGLTWLYGVQGFFWAVVVTTSIMVGLFFSVVRKDLAGHLKLPSWREITYYGKSVMHIGAFMYLSRIFFVVWQRLPLLVLGGVLAADELGYLNISLTFGSKLTIIAMALSEVNLSWMSTLFTTSKREFARVVSRNMQRVLVLMTLMTLVMLFFTREILIYIIGAEYLPAQPYIFIVTTAFFLYALVDIGTSSLFVPADKPRLRAYTYAGMTGLTAIIMGWIFYMNPSALAASYAMLAGGVLAYTAMILIAYTVFRIRLLTLQLFVFLAALGVSVWWLLYEPALLYRIGVFGLLSVYIVWETYRHELLPNLKTVIPGIQNGGDSHDRAIICFAGAELDRPSWTNRQHISTRLAHRYPLLYVEPRVWIVRYVVRHWNDPRKVFSFLKRLVWFEQRTDNLYVISQANLIPGSRQIRIISWFNRMLNQWHVAGTARILGFIDRDLVMWIYDTEAAEYLDAFSSAKVVYDCVDDHAAQAGVDRNPSRVEEEERIIMERADLVTVTSTRLLELKKKEHRNVHLVLNAGDVDLFSHRSNSADSRMRDIPRPIIGTVGALDSYKVDFELLHAIASARPEWSFVFIGSTVVDRNSEYIERMKHLPNVYMFGAIDRLHVPAFVHQFDVCMIPYRDSRYNSASFPLKFWEFMATGKPIVVSGVPELERYNDVIWYVRGPDEFIEGVTSALSEDAGRSRMRMEMATEHSWNERAHDLMELLHRINRR